MKIDSEKDIMKLKPSISKKVKSFALLPPFLTSNLLDLTKQFPRYYLLSFIKALKIAEKNAIKDNDSENLEKNWSYFTTNLYFYGVWKMRRYQNKLRDEEQDH